MEFLLIVVLVSLALLLLYLVSRRVRGLGQALAFVCQAVSRIAIRVSEFLTLAGNYCHQACLSSLAYPPSDSTLWGGLKVLSRLVFFVLSVLILAGETMNTLTALPSLLHTTLRLQLPGVVEFASGALFICTPALLGAVVLEMIGLIPSGTGLFPQMGKGVRWALGLLSGLFLILSVLLTGEFYLFRAAYLNDPSSTSGMSLVILGGLGLSIAAVSVLALWALVIGSAGVVSAILWIVEQVCRIASALSSIVPSLLDVIAIHISQGTMSVHGEFRGHETYQVPPLFVASSPSQKSGSYLPARASVVDADVVEAQPIDSSLEEKEEMSNPEKNANLSVVGSGSQLFYPIGQKISSIGVSPFVLTSSFLDLRFARGQNSIDGVYDLSPSHGVIKNALLRGESEQRVYETVLNDLASRLVEAHLPLKAVASPFVNFVDASLLPCVVEPLCSVHRRLPMVSQAVVTSISSKIAKREEVQEGLSAMLRLYREGCIETMFIHDPNSPFASSVGEETQLAFFAQMIASLLAAHSHSHRNLPFTTLLKELHASSFLTAFSFASSGTALGELPKRFKFLPGLSGRVGKGQYSDIIAQARFVVDRVLTDFDTCAFPVPVGNNSPCYVILNVPLALSDPRFSTCASDMALYVETTYQNARCLVVRGNGCSYTKHETEKFRVQASCLYPVSELMLLDAQRARGAKVTPIFTSVAAIDPVKVNGLMNSAETQSIESPKEKKPRSRGTPSRKSSRKRTQVK